MKRRQAAEKFHRYARNQVSVMVLQTLHIPILERLDACANGKIGWRYTTTLWDQVEDRVCEAVSDHVRDAVTNELKTA